MDAGAQPSVGRSHLCERHCERTAGGVEVGAGAPLPVERADSVELLGSLASGISLGVKSLHPPQWAGIWRCCSGRESTTVRERLGALGGSTILLAARGKRAAQ